MSSNVTLALLIGVLFGSGVVLLMSRGIVRAFLGVLLISNGINLMFIAAAGRPGLAPIVDDTGDQTGLTDPLPQALVLTAIVIALGTIAFVLAMAHRSWQLNQHDDVQDDVEDAAIRRKAIDDTTSDSYGLTTRRSDEDRAHDDNEEEAAT